MCGCRDGWRKQLAKTEKNGAIWANQFDNVANRQAHIESTGPEIWQQTDGKIDGFTCAVGSGGTLAGVAIALKERQSKNIRIAAADPLGAAIYTWIKTGELEAAWLLHHRRHRPEPRHRQSGRRADRRRL